MQSVFENRTFRRLFAGRLVTNAGDSLYYVAAMWLVYDLGGSAFYTGLAGALTLGPQALQFLAGPLVDRWKISRTLVGTQLLQAVLVLVVPIAHFTGHLSVGLVLVVMPVLALCNQFVYPAETAALPRVVEDEELVDANSAFSFAYQGVDLAFNAAGGVLVAAVGAVAIYTLDAVTFALAAGLFAVARIPSSGDGDEVELDANPDTEEAEEQAPLTEYFDKLQEGIDHVRGTVLVPVIAGSVVVNFTIGATMAVLPAFAAERGGPETYGLLLAAITGGMLVGALVASPLKRRSLYVLSATGFAVGGVLWFAALAVPQTLGTVALFALAWVPVGVTNVVFAAFKQSVVPDHLLGRVSSVGVSAGTAAAPLGSLLGGTVADAWTPTLVVAATGLGFLFLTFYWVVHPSLRGMPALSDIDPGDYGLAREPAGGSESESASESVTDEKPSASDRQTSAD
ncbi:MFS transporter [Halorussus halophilus]|uniref:MFS transporter n=1 Tax=Halorussus halophilus TaxID=2650975 RepID=UPI00130144E5|nr:MFS transporter [Halorussus halophilus]